MNAVTIFFDLDGVLANFVRGALRAHGREDVHERDVQWGIEQQLGIDPGAFWSKLGRDFWFGLEPHADGFDLLDVAESLVGPHGVAILSSPCQTDGCMDGKRDWVWRHLPEGYERRLFLGSAKHLFAAPNKVLVDDNDKNCDQFLAAGGRVVRVPRPWNSYKFQCLMSDGVAFDVAHVASLLQDEVREARKGRAA